MFDGIKRELAVFTIVQDEPEFIHPWINHYKKHVADPRDLHVLVHAPARPDGPLMRIDELPAWHRAQALMTDHHSVTALSVHRRVAFDHYWLADTVARFQSFLLSSYDWVLFTEIDEFVLPMPGATPAVTLLDFVQGLGTDPPAAIRATGFEVVQQAGEPPVAPALYGDGANTSLTAADLIDGCQSWYRSDGYSKTLLANVPLRWNPGFHGTSGVVQDIATGAPSAFLALVHLHRADFDLALGRTRRSRARNWSQADRELGHGKQNQLGDDALRTYWGIDADTDAPLQSGRLEPIAPGIKQALRR